jgi:hypothetical protein
VAFRKDTETASEAEWSIVSERAKVMDGLLSRGGSSSSVAEAELELKLHPQPPNS